MLIRGTKPFHKGILFFSRGRGRGHAIPDITLVDAMKSSFVLPWADIRFVSYGTGAKTFREFGKSVIDLDLPDDNPFLETLRRSALVIRSFRPKFIISHEEFAALLAAKLYDVPTMLVIDWLPTPIESISTQSVGYADNILFIEEPGLFKEPPYLTGRIQYVGRMVRKFVCNRLHRDSVRQELNIPSDALVISVIPGAWATEARAPIADLLMQAFDDITIANKLLLWIAGSDWERLSTIFAARRSVRIQESYWPIERIMVASDVVITKGNRGTIAELYALGVPSLSLSFGLNPVDDLYSSRFATNIALDARSVASSDLAKYIISAAVWKGGQSTTRCPTSNDQSGVDAAAAALAEHIRRLRNQSKFVTAVRRFLTTSSGA